VIGEAASCVCMYCDVHLAGKRLVGFSHKIQKQKRVTGENRRKPQGYGCPFLRDWDREEIRGDYSIHGQASGSIPYFIWDGMRASLWCVRACLPVTRTTHGLSVRDIDRDRIKSKITARIVSDGN
jgi:hypothetical protein